MKRFDIQLSEMKVKGSARWKSQFAAILGGLAIILIVLMALPLVILIILYIQIRKIFPSKTLPPEPVPVWPWEVFIKNEFIQIDRKFNHDLEKYQSLDNHFAHAIETGEFLAFGLRSTPIIEDLKDLHFDYDFLEFDDGIFLRAISPLDEWTEDPIYYLDYIDKTIQIITNISSEADIEMKISEQGEILIQGHEYNNKFELKIRIIDSDL